MSILADDFDIDQQVDESFFHLICCVRTDVKDKQLPEDILSQIGPFRIIENEVVFAKGYPDIFSDIKPIWEKSRLTKPIRFTVYCSQIQQELTITVTERLMSGALTTSKITYMFSNKR